jgi:hypothetical protein
MDSEDPYKDAPPGEREKLANILAIDPSEVEKFHHHCCKYFDDGKATADIKTVGVPFVPPHIIVLSASKDGTTTVMLYEAEASLLGEDVPKAMYLAAMRYLKDITVTPGDKYRIGIPVAVTVVYEGRAIHREKDDNDPTREPTPDELARAKDIATVITCGAMKHMVDKKFATLWEVTEGPEGRVFTKIGTSEEDGGVPYVGLFCSALNYLIDRDGKNRGEGRHPYNTDPGVN